MVKNVPSRVHKLARLDIDIDIDMLFFEGILWKLLIKIARMAKALI
jgi:hypothetical protein